MPPLVDPRKFGLPARTNLEKTGKNRFSIIIERKSRIVMKDGQQILNKANILREMIPGAKIDLKITGPLCSKTLAFLKDHEIDVIQSRKE